MFFRVSIQVPTVANDNVFINVTDVKNLSKQSTASVFLMELLSFLTTLSSTVLSTYLSSFPLYVHIEMIPARESLLTHNFIPRLMGLEGKYCFKLDLPLNLATLSSID